MKATLTALLGLFLAGTVALRRWRVSTRLVLSGALLLLAIRLPAASHSGSLDLTFDPTAGGLAVGLTGGSPHVSAVLLQPDGTVLVGGWFNGVNGSLRNNIARLKGDGTLDLNFAPGLGADGEVSGLARQPDGKVILIGSFHSVGGQQGALITRLNADGSVDGTFNCRVAGDLHLTLDALAVQTDGSLWIGGRFTNVNGIARLNLARLHPNGSLDASFDPQGLVPGINTAIHQIRLQADGKVLVSGLWGLPRLSLIRLNADGSLDQTFHSVTAQPSGYYDAIYDMFSHSDGTIAIVGTFESVNGVSRRYAARLQADGTLDTSFDADFGRWATAVGSVVVQPDGKFVVGGWFTEVDGAERLGAARLNIDGSLDTDFDSSNVIGRPPGTAYQPSVLALALQSDGHVLFGTSPWWLQDNSHTVFRVDSEGRRDPGFTSLLQAPIESVVDMALQPDGKVVIVVLGSFGGGWGRLMRLNPNGVVDEDFQPETSVPWLNALTVQSDGKILVNSGDGPGLLRLRTDGSVDTTFQAPPIAGYDQGIETLVVQADGKILVGGLLLEVGGSSYKGIARLHADGRLDTSFHSVPIEVGDDAGGGVEHILVLPNGKILIGGGFAWDDGAYSPAGIALLHTDGTLDSNYLANLPVRGHVWSAALQSDGKILVSGYFVEAGVYGENLIRLNIDGTKDNTFQPAAPGEYSTLAVQADGRILTVKRWETNGIVRLRRDGSLDSTFQGPAELSGLERVLIQPDGQLLVAGAFHSVSGIPMHGIARLNNDLGWLLEVAPPTAPGQFRLTVTGRPGARLIIERSSDLRTWGTLGEVTTVQGPVHFVDPDTAQSGQRFYRAREAE